MRLLAINGHPFTNPFDMVEGFNRDLSTRVTMIIINPIASMAGGHLGPRATPISTASAAAAAAAIFSLSLFFFSSPDAGWGFFFLFSGFCFLPIQVLEKELC